MKAPLAPVKNSRLMVFDENKGLAEPQDPKLESWMGPPSARHKENEQKPDKWTKAKVVYVKITTVSFLSVQKHQ